MGETVVAMARARNIRATLGAIRERISAIEAMGGDASVERRREGIALIQLATAEADVTRGVAAGYPKELVW